MQTRTDAQQGWQHPVHMFIHRVVLSGGRGWVGALVMGVGPCWALYEGGRTLAAMLNEIQVMIELPSGLLPSHLQPCMTAAA